MRKHRILFDCDGIFTDFVGGVLSQIEVLTGTCLTPEDFPVWDVFDHVKVLFPEQPDLKKQLIAHIEEPGFCANLAPYPGAEEALARLLKLQHEKKIDLFIVTSPWLGSPTWGYERANWLHHRGVPKRHVINASAKEIISGDLFIDDKAEHVDDWSEANHGTAFLWDTPHNRGDKTVARRLQGWEDFFSILEARIR